MAENEGTRRQKRMPAQAVVGPAVEKKGRTWEKERKIGKKGISAFKKDQGGRPSFRQWGEEYCWRGGEGTNDV